MKVNDWLLAAERQLSAATARLDSLVLLEDALGTDRAHILAHPELTLTNQQCTELKKWLDQRAQHIPLAYIRGHVEFYGRDFTVTPAVLIPRPETETMIELIKKWCQPTDTIADIGTGSGAIAITVHGETKLPVSAVDISSAALAVARHNAQIHHADVHFFKTDLLAGFINDQPTPSIIAANLPYVPTNHAINQAAEHEPAVALFGGDDGLDLYRRLLAQTADCPHPPRLIITESLPMQHAALARIAAQWHYHLEETDDFMQVFAYQAPAN